MSNDDIESLKTSKRLEIIHEKLNQRDSVKIRDIVDLISSESNYLLILILVAPFLLPVSIPGSSTPFGLLIIFLAFSSLSNKPLHITKKVSETEMTHESLDKLFNLLDKFLYYIEKVSHPRGNLTDNKNVLKLNNLIMIILAFALFLPLPIPFTDFIPSLAILILSVSNLEKDTYLMIIGYLAAIGAVYYFYSVGSLGIDVIVYTLNHFGITF